jgi:O-acetyl-ADP-ribose deacetylase (regulator of RNase III)
VKEIQDRVGVIRDIAKKNMQEAHERAKQQHDKRGTATPTYAPGDLVYVHRDHLKKHECAKLADKFNGAFLILHEGPNFTYKLRNMETGKELKHMVNASRLRPYRDSRDEFYTRNGVQCDPNEPDIPAAAGEIPNAAATNHNQLAGDDNDHVDVQLHGATQSKRPENGTKGQRQYNVTLQSGLKVSIFTGDILSTPAQIVVNPANEKLYHGKGVAGYLARKAGPTMIQESRAFIRQHGCLQLTACMHTSPGNIPPPVRYVLHAVGPRNHFCQDKTEICRLLRLTYFHALKAAEKLGGQSIVFPAMSCGIFQVPSEISAKAAHKAICLYDSEPTEVNCGKLEHIFIVDTNHDTLVPFMKAFESNNQNSHVQPANGTLDANEQLELGIEPSANSTSGGWYRVKRVLKDKKAGETRMYLVVWEDNSRSWVAEKDMAPKSLRDYLVHKHECKLRRRRKRQY